MERPPDKVCARCARRITWRKRWAREWENLRYCGERCRRTRLDAVDEALEREMLVLLERRPRGATICPSEVVRALAGDDETAWRALMERARSAARRLVERGLADITQRGRAIDPSTARGPIRVRLRA